MYYVYSNVFSSSDEMAVSFRHVCDVAALATSPVIFSYRCWQLMHPDSISSNHVNETTSVTSFTGIFVEKMGCDIAFQVLLNLAYIFLPLLVLLEYCNW